MKTLLAALLGLAVAVSAKADLVTLWNTPSNGVISTVSISIPTNVVAKFVSLCVGQYSTLALSKNGQTYALYFGPSIPATLPTFIGPATLTISGSNYVSYLTMDTNALITPPPYIPSTAVVIPDDSNGPVNIILESSTDLLNWTPALPGTYGTTSSNRFFRVRATR